MGPNADPAVAAGAPAVEVETFRAELKPVSGPASGRESGLKAGEDREPVAKARQDAEPAPFTWPQNDTGAGDQMRADEDEDADEQGSTYAEPADEATAGSDAGQRDVARMPAAGDTHFGEEKDDGRQPAAAERRSVSHISGGRSSDREIGTAARPSMLSADSGRKVAAAFEELNEVFEAKRAKGLDQVAEEMLRPMLQEWLDNNLPTLVERLVREEIERVARGG
ncbi:PopZ family protein [Nitratireductor luteus]|uniref:PopZ family protein n=1 Tax=Nitratireductor luteus TaxID=2976980 RepID=UPI003B84862A